MRAANETAAAAGVPADPDEIARLGREHAGALLAYARRVARSEAEAQDLVQDTFERALRGVASVAPGARRAWLFTVLKNLFLDRCRRAKKERGHADVDALDIAAETPASVPRWAALSTDDVRAAVAELDDDFRRAYELHALEGRSYKEIADALGIPANTVGTRVFRAKRRLKELLEQCVGPRSEP